MKRLTKTAALALALALGAAAQVAPPRPKPKPQPGAISAPQVIVRDASFHSIALGREMKYRVILPAEYESKARRYPVLYLLHGLTGSYSDWESRTRLALYAQPLGLIIVMPDAGNSWYTDSASIPADKFETYIAEDLIKEVELKYRAISTRHGRAIAGLSMGGYGALKIALKHPALFAFAGSFSGALEAPNLAAHMTNPKFRDELLAIYGPPGSTARTENDVFTILANAQVTGLPYLYLDCGTDDPLLKSNRDFLDKLNRQKAPYEYHELPGAHTWQYWDHEVQLLLSSLARHIDLR